MNDGAYGSEVHKLRSEGCGGRFSVGYCDFAAIARGFGSPDRAAVWYFHVSDKVLSPTLRHAYPHPAKKGA
ncbi:MAG TPA: hypothetical protein VFT23_08440 [Burkholderiales bacterium]|nr:hypothetical protein [Burkholderiales bacterium]